MKYLLTFKARRKNAKRHALTLCGRVRYFDSIAEAEKVSDCMKDRYGVEICDAKYNVVKVIRA
nr:MAG TPA: hypothetical protein [Caudoviricetes sp.]